MVPTVIRCILDSVILPRDTHFLYEIISSEDQYLYSTKLRFYSEQNFEQWLYQRLNHDFHDFYIIRDTHSSSIFGYVHNYDFSLTDGHCKLVVCIAPKFRATGIGSVAAILFMQQLFDMYPLRKLYSTIYDYNRESLRSNLAAGFTLEGTIQEYRYFNGKFHDMHYLSISREQFKKTLGKLVGPCFA